MFYENVDIWIICKQYLNNYKTPFIKCFQRMTNWSFHKITVLAGTLIKDVLKYT